MKKLLWLLLLAGLVAPLRAQIPVELLVGHQRTSLDVMWFRPFQKAGGGNSRFLLFNRNRVSVESDVKPPLWGSTNAVSYNFKSGLGAVAVGQFLGSGFVPKAGVQYFKRLEKQHLTLFTWLVQEVKEQPNTDWFLLLRHESALGRSWSLFAQTELFSVTNWAADFSLVQRLRLGLSRHGWQAGAGADFSQNNFSSAWLKTRNVGAFVRHEF